MTAVVAAGQRATAAAALEVLNDGGNAVDAAIAACAASFVTEPMLTSAGGGGLMTVDFPDREPVVIDFFSDAPGLSGRTPAKLDFFAVDIDFGTVTQEFHIGRSAAAVPGMLPGLAEAHRLFASRDLTYLMAPAQRLARQGVAVTAETAHTFKLLWPLLCGSAETVALYGGGCPQLGEVLVNPALADTLDEFARTGTPPPRFFDGVLEGFGPDRGGLIGEDDLRNYAPQVREPLAIELGDWRGFTSPLVGGQLVAVIAGALAAGQPGAGEAAELLRFGRASAAGHEQRHALTAPGSTTHISVIDNAGGAVALTVTNGEGCGQLIGNTGVQLNNFLGEEDLNPHGFHQHVAGIRLPTMMAPTIGARAGRPVLALGSGGSNRIRTAVGQVLYRVSCLGSSIEQAVAAPRVHAEGDVVWVELEGVADPDAAVAALAGEFDTVHPFAAHDFFFGGVHAAFVDETGRCHGAGDDRRGGAALIG